MEAQFQSGPVPSHDRDASQGDEDANRGTAKPSRKAPLRVFLIASVVVAALVASAAFASRNSRTWAGEIDVCVQATGDIPGCQWLAGLMIHRHCKLEAYQTFAAGLSVGASVDQMYGDALQSGDCEPTSGETGN